MNATTSSLRRPADDRMLAGVCAALGRYFNIDVTWVRIGWVLFTLLGGSGILAYLIGWFVIPDANGQRAYAPLWIALVLLVLPMLCAVFGVFGYIFNN